MNFHFFKTKPLESYEVVDTAAQDLLQYNIKLMKDHISTQAEEIFKLRKENEELKESLKNKNDTTIPLVRQVPKITTMSELRDRLERATRK